MYLSSQDGADGDDGSTWALAKATLAAALTAAGAGGTVYMDNAHAETQASALNATSSGTAASPTTVICASRASGAPPTAVATTGTVSTTGANHITLAGIAHYYGVQFQAGDAASNARVVTSTSATTLDNCILKLNNTNASSLFVMNGYTECRNCTFNFGAVGQSFNLGASTFAFISVGGSIAGTAPTTMMAATNLAIYSYFRGVDLSLLGSGKTILSLAGNNNSQHTFENCKLGASVTLSSGSLTGRQAFASFVNCDSANTNYRYSRQTYGGTATQETTIVRTGGATDGVTPFSRKLVSTANSKFYEPMESDFINFWNDSLSSITVTIPTVTDNVTLNNGDAWIEVEELGTSSFPLSVMQTCRAADILASTANQPTDSTSTWTTTGLTTPVKQSLAVTFTPTVKGWVRVKVMLAKASTTMYYDPTALTGAVQYMGGHGEIMNYPPSGAIFGGLIVGQAMKRSSSM